MKKLIIILCISAAILASCSSVLNNPNAMNAVVNATRALTISDAEVIALTDEFIKESDAANTIAPENSDYALRLKRLTDRYSGGKMNLNFKVYMTEDVNAFATANGSVRVYSGLMDIMGDDELLGIIGHEIGHVANNDVKDAMRNAYLTVAATNAVGATSSTMARLTNSQLSQLFQVFSSSQYSQRQENEADDYGFNFLVNNGYNPMAMATSLGKLNSLSGGGQSSVVANAFSSHPDSAARTARMREKAEEYLKANPSRNTSSSVTPSTTSAAPKSNTSSEWSF